MWPATGRAVRLRMYGVSERELAGRVDGGELSFFDKLEIGNPDSFRLPADVPDLPGYIDLALRSGFPDIVYRGRDEAARRIWLDSYLEQLLTRDATSLGHARDPARLRPYFEALALNTAGIAADKTIYDAAGVNARTAAAYDQLLANLFVLEFIPAWSTNRLRRLVKTAKRYIVDPGLVASGAGLTTRDALADGDLLGRIIDTFAVSQLRPEVALSEDRCRLYHLRIDGGRHEVDLVVERGAGQVLGIEIKAGAAPDKRDARHLEWLRDELGDRFLAGAVLHRPRGVPAERANPRPPALRHLGTGVVATRQRWRRWPGTRALCPVPCALCTTEQEDVGDFHPRSSRADVGDHDFGSVSGEQLQVRWVYGRDDRPPCQVANGDDERVDCLLRPRTGAAKQLTGSHSDTAVDRMNFDTLPPEAGEHSGITRVSTDDFGKDSGNGPNRKLSMSHLRDERPHSISTGGRTVSES